METSTKKLQQELKSTSPDGKRVGSVESCKENGVRASASGKEDLFDYNLDGGIVTVVTEKKVVETEIEVKSEGDSKHMQELDSPADAENEVADGCISANDGISLLLDVSSEMEREDCGDFNGEEDDESSNGESANSDGNIREWSDSEDGEEDDSCDGDYEFCVGDFVWGKIKSYPWWPGQIYDSSDASDYALKVKPRDRILVAYFDGTFAWCHPSQLKPFEKNFVEMSKQSSTKSFVNAVQMAVDEIGRLVELKMTCSCVPKESLDILARPLAENSGIRAGVLVPEGGIAKLWNYLFGPSECLAELKHVARVTSIDNLLEFTELKCWLSAFYRVGGGNQLALYHEPQPIPGLEDNNSNDILDLSRDAEGPIKGPVEEETNPSLLKKCLVSSENGHHQRRKQKSIAEIMESYVDTPARNLEEGVTKEGSGLRKPAPLSSRKKSKGNDLANGGSNLSFKTKRRKVIKLLESTPATEPPFSSDDSDGSKVKENTKRAFLSREKEKIKASHSENDDGSKEEGNTCPVSVESKTVHRDDDKAKEQVEKSFFSRERKRSKYLSPPYTSINRRQTKKDLEAEFLKVCSEARMAERMTRAAAILIGTESPVNSMCGDEVREKNNVQDNAEHEKYDTPNPETMKIGQSSSIDTTKLGQSSSIDTTKLGQSSSIDTTKLGQSRVIDMAKVKAPTENVLSGIRSMAINLKSVEKDSRDEIQGFVLIFRSSVYSDGSYYKVYNKSQPGSKMTLDSESVLSAEDQNQTELKSSEQRSRRSKKKKNKQANIMKDDPGKSDEPIRKQARDANTKPVEIGVTDDTKLKQVMRSQHKKRKEEETDGKAAPGINANDKQGSGRVSHSSLIVTFDPTSSLPSEDDLFRTYSKFTSLNKEETEMFYNKYYAQIVFTRSSDAEEAFKSSQLASPFGTLSCKFELQNSSFTSKKRKVKEISNAKCCPSNEGGRAKRKSGSKSPNAEASPFDFVKHKLESIASVLANSDGKMSPDLKSHLEGEVKELLDTVNSC